MQHKNESITIRVNIKAGHNYDKIQGGEQPILITFPSASRT